MHMKTLDLEEKCFTSNLNIPRLNLVGEEVLEMWWPKL